MKEGTLIGFRIIIDSDGVLMTEQTELPDEHISKVFGKKRVRYLFVRLFVHSKRLPEICTPSLKRRLMPSTGFASSHSLFN